MSLFRRIIVRAAREFAQNPEAREKATEVFQNEVKPRAKKAWKEAQPEIENAKVGLKRFAGKLKEEYRKGRDGV